MDEEMSKNNFIICFTGFFSKKKYNGEELIRYQNRKFYMFKWYSSLNTFLENIEKMWGAIW